MYDADCIVAESRGELKPQILPWSKIHLVEQQCASSQCFSDLLRGEPIVTLNIALLFWSGEDNEFQMELNVRTSSH